MKDGLALYQRQAAEVTTFILEDIEDGERGRQRFDELLYFRMLPRAESTHNAFKVVKSRLRISASDFAVQNDVIGKWDQQLGVLQCAIIVVTCI